MLEFIGELILKVLFVIPWARRAIMFAALAILSMTSAIGWGGFAVWIGIFLGLEAKDYFLPRSDN